MQEYQEKLIEIKLSEYEKLKDEQISRIGFRDNLLYVTLTVYGALAAYSLADSSRYQALLVLPWICIILGWTYLVNDEKITAIGSYIKKDLTESLTQLTANDVNGASFKWESAHRNYSRRKRRKYEQLVVDLSAFVIPGIIAIVGYWSITSTKTITSVISGGELLVLIILSLEFIGHATGAAKEQQDVPIHEDSHREHKLTDPKNKET